MMKHGMVVFALVSFVTCAVGDDAPSAPAPGAAARPRQALPAAPPAAKDAAADKATSAPGAPKFVTEARWLLAGYNNNEIVYQVFVTNQGAQIIRCTTEVQGFYFENGKKLSISDRQVTTVFPNQRLRSAIGWTWIKSPAPIIR